MKKSAPLTVEMWPTHRPVPYQKNPRVISDAAITKVATSIQQFGFRVPIVCDEDDLILAGHTRQKAAEQLGLSEVPVHVARGLTAAQKKAFRLADNRTAQESTWASDLLGLELSDIQDLEEFDITFTGFSAEEIRVLVDGPSFDPVSEDEQGRLDEKKKIICPNCSHEFSPS